MLCQASWIPAAVAGTLRDHRSAQPLIAWLGSLRADTEEYDPLVTVQPPERSRSPSPAHSPHTEPDAASPESAFDEILSQIGKEIYKLEQYQRNLVPEEKDEISRSVLNLFDKCLEYLSDNNSENNSDLDACDATEVTEMKPAENGVADVDSDCESTLSDISIVTSTPADCEKVMTRYNKRAPAPPPRARLKTPSSSSSPYEEMDGKTDDTLVEAAKRLCLTDSDSESTCWRYKDCSADENEPDAPTYSSVWCHSSGYNNSDRILRDLLAQNHATESRISFDTASDFSPSEYTVYSLHEVGGDRCGAVADMAPGRPADDGYEPVRTNVENDYEEIGFGTSYTDEGYSCEGSIEVESCSISASSECGRESPLYVNLKDHAAYTLSSDVRYWRHLLWDPYYNDDEEDEWITPEECAVYSREQRPPLVIPRITQYRPIHQSRLQPAYAEEPQEPPLVKSSPRNYDRLQEWSPTLEKSRAEMDRSFSKANSDSPPFTRLNKRFGGSTENLLSNIRRPTHLNLPASSSGDSLDVEVREHKEPGYARSRKSRSMVAPKHRMRSPVPVPRTMMPTHAEAAVLSEGPVKRTKFSESGKKCRKNWTDCYMVLTPTALIFYKDERTYQASKVPRPPGTPPSPTAARAELVLPLRNAHVMQCIQNHTRRYTRSIVLTVGYDQYLLQDDSEEGARRWMKNIQNVYYKLGPPRGDDYPLHSQSSNTDLESLGRTPPVSRHSNRSHKAGGSSNEDLSDSTEVSIPKVKRTLRNFFAKRPTMDSLVKKGIYQEEPVFGRKLDEVCPTTSPRVPDFVVACVKEIESSEENMCTDGLYRASGNLSQVQKIRLEVDQSKMSVLETSADIHVLTGSLKLFFRELKEPLIPCSIFDRVLAACSIKPREAKIKEFRDIVNALPQCNRETLKFVLEHLLRVTKYSERNRMHTANLAIVFGPTLLWAPAEQAHNIAIDCIQQNHVVEILLNEFKEIFEDAKGKKKT